MEDKDSDTHSKCPTKFLTRRNTKADKTEIARPPPAVRVADPNVNSIASRLSESIESRVKSNLQLHTIDTETFDGLDRWVYDEDCTVPRFDWSSCTVHLATGLDEYYAAWLARYRRVYEKIRQLGGVHVRVTCPPLSDDGGTVIRLCATKSHSRLLTCVWGLVYYPYHVRPKRELSLLTDRQTRIYDVRQFEWVRLSMLYGLADRLFKSFISVHELETAVGHTEFTQSVRTHLRDIFGFDEEPLELCLEYL